MRLAGIMLCLNVIAGVLCAVVWVVALVCRNFGMAWVPAAAAVWFALNVAAIGRTDK